MSVHNAPITTIHTMLPGSLVGEHRTVCRPAGFAYGVPVGNNANCPDCLRLQQSITDIDLETADLETLEGIFTESRYRNRKTA